MGLGEIISLCPTIQRIWLAVWFPANLFYWSIWSRFTDFFWKCPFDPSNANPNIFLLRFRTWFWCWPDLL